MFSRLSKVTRRIAYSALGAFLAALLLSSTLQQTGGMGIAPLRTNNKAAPDQPAPPPQGP